MAIYKAFLPQWGMMEIQGDDRVSFLQGLITNDMEMLGKDRPLYAALLTPQGRFLYDFFLINQGDSLFLETKTDWIVPLIQKLTLYKLRSQVTLIPRPDLKVYAMWGQDLSPPPSTYRDPRSEKLGVRGWTEDEHGEAILVTWEDYDLYRLQLGIPEGGRDLIPEKSIPLESGLDQLNAISWTKGCYMGQELTARTKYQGIVRKRLTPVTFETDSLPFGAEILKNSESVGKMYTSRGGYGLAMLRLESLETQGDFMCGDRVLVPKAGFLENSADI